MCREICAIYRPHYVLHIFSLQLGIRARATSRLAKSTKISGPSQNLQRWAKKHIHVKIMCIGLLNLISSNAHITINVASKMLAKWPRCRGPTLNGLLILLTGAALTALYCEYGIYYVVALQCAWPTVDAPAPPHPPLRALLIADPHLLGPRKGHWLDKWRREGQMSRAFQALIALHMPDVVFFLGDLFDEGLWSTDAQFKAYVDRFRHLFRVPETTLVYHVVGNHDIGFHHDISLRRAKRFEEQLNSPSVQLLSIRGNHIVLLNSMAMEGDGCSLCRDAMDKIEEISKKLTCSNGHIQCTEHETLTNFSRPILMQHFPLFRASDAACSGPHLAPPAARSVPFRDRIDAVSERSTDWLVGRLRPRAAFGAHTHHGCRVRRRGFDEHSVPSFSWRNRPDYVTSGPKYFLVTMTPQDIGVSVCDLPRETTVALTAVILLSVSVYCAINYKSIRRRCRKIAF